VRSLEDLPAALPVGVELTAAPTSEGDLATDLLAAGTSAPSLAIPVSGTAVQAKHSATPAISLGTFCVQQPTAPRIIALTATGSATIGVTAPVLQTLDSPFDLELVAPLRYPTAIGPGDSVLVAVTPQRRASAAEVSDDVVWTTDVEGAETARTRLTASFVDDGGAIAPPALVFGATPIHLDTRNAQQVRLQNCGAALLQLDAPIVPSPFAIESRNFPSALQPGETATFSVGFHPTKEGDVVKTLIITSPQMPGEPLAVALSGVGVAGGGDGDDPAPNTGSDAVSFYTCGSCAAADPSTALALTVAGLAVLWPRRRRR
jgi:MYXO-CTERM domain-containing protein